jgi:excisionase family DNA binding protein
VSTEVALRLSLPPEFIEALAQRVADLVADQLECSVDALSWLKVESAAKYLDTSEDAIRGMVKRGQLIPHRSTTGRLLFRRDALDRHAIGDAA